MKKKSPREQKIRSTKLGEAVVQIIKRARARQSEDREGLGGGRTRKDIFSKVREKLVKFKLRALLPWPYH